MRTTELLTILLTIFLMHVPMADTNGVEAYHNCAIDVQNRAAEQRNSCMVQYTNSSACTHGYNLLINHIRSLCGSTDTVRYKRSEDIDSCVYVPRFRGHICFTGDYIYQLGQAAIEPCNTPNHGKQKCVDSETYITCVWNDWIIQNMCAPGTRCQAYPGSNRHIMCGY